MNQIELRHEAAIEKSLGLFDGFGVELEYMIVGADGLSVRPIADELLKSAAGEITGDFENGDISWSNELALHVIELKTSGPADSLYPLPRAFSANVRQINDLLSPLGGRLMPAAMHPWMDPAREMKLWPHDNSPVYEAFNRIFDCRGHGWANLQSMHINLPFHGDAEFARLHAAIRLLLPILPALAASSPIVEGQPTGLLDSRLEVYRHNARRVPSVSGRVIPEPVFDQQSYEEQILQRIYNDLSPHDPAGILRHEWANARGAIARFERDTIEIRVIDVQECPQADLAICAAVVEVLRALVDEHWTPLAAQKAFSTESLEQILLATIRDGYEAVIDDPRYLEQFGYPVSGAAGAKTTAHDLWRFALDSLGMFKSKLEASWGEPLRVILQHGPLARRILRTLHGDYSRAKLSHVYGELCDCLAENRVFVGHE
jgi:gamma-glutamyl:cysteine ligase YbdK (ATP-grasp superfamily)